MDHQAFAQLLGNYGEFVGSLAVLITLGYIAVQVRHTRLENKRALAQSRVESNRALIEMELADENLSARVQANMALGFPFSGVMKSLMETAELTLEDTWRAWLIEIASWN